MVAGSTANQAVKILNELWEFSNPATEEKQDDIIAELNGLALYPDGTGANGTVTLTSSSTAYAVPSGTPPTDRYVLVMYNGSDTDMYFGYVTLTTGGILLPAGGIATLNLGANQVMYVYCLSAGKIINYSLKEI